MESARQHRYCQHLCTEYIQICYSLTVPYFFYVSWLGLSICQAPPPPPPAYDSSLVSNNNQQQQQPRRQTVSVSNGTGTGGGLEQMLAKHDPRRSSMPTGGTGGSSVCSDGSGETQQTAGTFMTTATANIPLTRVTQRASSTMVVKGAYFLDNPVIQSVCKKITYFRRPDKTRVHCFKCKKGFGLRTQRHHCRSCGDVYW